MAADASRATVAADWSVYDRAELADAASAPGRGAQREALVGLELHCAACVARVERTLRGRAATDVRVNLAARVAEFGWDPRRTTLSALLKALDEAGFQPQILAQDADLRAQAAARRSALARLGVSAILSMQVMMLAWPTYFTDMPVEFSLQGLFRWAQWLLATPVVLYGGWPFFRNAARALAQRALDMDVPVALALGIAYLASAWRTMTGEGEIYFDSATMFVLFLAAGRYLEGRTRGEAAQRLRLLAGRRRLTALRLHAGGVEEIPVAALRPGDSVQVRAGEALPVDGELVSEAAEVDESLLTGEALPVARGPGQTLLAGSLNAGAQPLVVRALHVGGDTRLSHIAKLLNQAQSSRPRFQQLADRLAGHFILAVLGLAALGAWFALDRGGDAALSVALAVLVASCPCALSLAVPAAAAAASSRLAAAGALLARPEALSRLRDADMVVFDKTGTLTGTGLVVAAVQPVDTLLDKDQCLALAAALEHDSPHPIARAFAGIAVTRRARELRSAPGRGVTGTIGDTRYWLGTPALAPAGVTVPPPPADGALTWVALGDDRRVLAWFGLAAPLRAEARATVGALRARGCALGLFTGDSAEAAQALARPLGIDPVQARQSPEDKLAQLRRLQDAGRVVVAVGDGINDAPFLAGADVAVAMPQGAALAQSRADVILLGDSLAPLPLLLDTARRATTVMRQNLAWALGYNLSVLPLAMGGWLAPWMAALGMALSSLLVVANARRLASDASPPAAA